MSNRGRILIADETLLLSTTDLLRMEGYVCNYVPDTMTVVEILKKVKYDLLIAGTNMAASGTFEIIKELQNNAKELSIILITDTSFSDAQIQSIKPYVTTWLSKPLCFEELLKPVECAIKVKVSSQVGR